MTPVESLQRILHALLVVGQKHYGRTGSKGDVRGRALEH
jgi:hypothetical protein